MEGAPADAERHGLVVAAAWNACQPIDPNATTC
jgi:hypothetical protein